MNTEPARSWAMQRSLEGPGARWKQAERLANQNGRRSSAESDDLTRRTAAYLDIFRSQPDGASRAVNKYPEVASAVATWNNDAMAEQLRILAIANCPQEEIAARLLIEEPIVALIEALFFDVRWALHASGWIVCQVIIPEVRAGALDLAAKLKLAFFGGPVMARAILNARVRTPFNDADRLFDREVLLQLKLQEALEAPLREGERIELFSLCLQYDINRGRLDLDKRKFAHQCQQTQRPKESEGQPRETATDDPQDESPKSESDWQWAGDDHSVVTKDILERLVA